MFRRRLSLVLVVLAAAVVLQGVAAVFAAREAQRQVVRGRIASDILHRFVDLSATKQRLRSWATQYQVGAGGDPAERDALVQRMRAHLGELDALTHQAAAVGLVAEAEARHDALQVLAHSVETLESAIRQTTPLPPDVQARQAWDALAAVFDQSNGRDLRLLVAQSIQRETAAMKRERVAADASLARMRATWMGTALVLALGALAATVYFGRALRRPLNALASGAQALQQGHLQHRIDLAGRDEFANVARSMNAMAEELELHRQREAQQRQVLEATDVRRRQLLADISHELRTPTTAIRGEAEVTLRGGERPVGEYREALVRIVDISRQLGAVIDDLLAMARTDMETLSLARQPVALRQPLQDALSLAAALAGEHQVTLVAEGELPARLTVFGDAQRLRQLMLLLLDNAVRYSLPGGQVHWRVAVRDGFVELSVLDHGIGIPPDELPQIFERHFRGAVARRHRASGSGLGLPIARALALAHGGTLDIASTHGQAGHASSTRATLRLPLWHGPEASIDSHLATLSADTSP